MRKPGVFDYLIGNPLSVIGLLAALAYAVYQWWSHGASLWFPFIVFIATAYAFNAGERLQKYREFKQEWDAMAGVRPGGCFRLPRPIQIIVAAILWIAVAWRLFSLPAGSMVSVARALLVLGTIVILLVPLAKRWWRRNTEKKKLATRDVIVTQCLKTAVQSPSAQQAFNDLPEYCRKLVS